MYWQLRLLSRDKQRHKLPPTSTSRYTLLFPASVQPDVMQCIRELATGKPVIVETEARHVSGHELAVSIQFTPHIDPPGLLTGFSAVVRDITTRKLSERALIQNEKLVSVGRLAASIAHEINNPLESVTNLLYILGYQTEDAEMKGTIQAAQEELARISEITKHTLRFHRHTVDQSLVGVPAMLTSILLLYRGQIQERGVIADLQPSTAAPLRCFDGEIRQVFSNLIGNALDALSRGGKLVLRCRDTYAGQPKTRSTRVTIADTGSGIPVEHLSQVFEPFFTTKGLAGSGLGLWITKELVAKNRGTIRLRSSNRGTIFVLIFPNV